jgi:formylglycine-generating enzyme required for sulfatase activity
MLAPTQMGNVLGTPAFMPDLKPGNIMLGKYGETLVVDWGLAKAVGKEKTATNPTSTVSAEPTLVPSSGSDVAPTQMGSAIGTPAFMSPEQATGRLDLLGPASDVYSLGATLYCVLTGQVPFAKGNVVDVLKNVENGVFPRPREVRPGVDAALEAICLKAMAKEPTDRYASAAALRKDLENWIADAPVSAWREPFSVKARRWLNRHRIFASSTAATLLAAVVFLGILFAVTSNKNEQLAKLADDETAAKIAAQKALAGEELQKQKRALAQVNALSDAAASAVPAILRALEENQASILPQLRERYAAEPPGLRRTRLALAILPSDPTAARGELIDWMLRAEDPAEALLAREARAAAPGFLDKLWAAVEAPEKGNEALRLRAAAALAKYDPQNDKWKDASAQVVKELVQQNALFLGQWNKAFAPVKNRLIPPLSAVFRDPKKREVERSLATDILADFAADEPRILADLLMDADEKQFAVLFPKLAERPEDGAPPLLAELARKAAPASAPLAGKEILKKDGTIDAADPRVKDMPSQRFDVPLEASVKYRIRMTSKVVDSFLVLHDAKGQEVGFDDDSGGGLDSLLEFTPRRSETYAVYAAALQDNANAKLAGPYVLTVTTVPAAALVPRVDFSARQANAAVALLRMKKEDKVWPVLKHSPDPSTRTWLMHRVAPYGVDPAVLIQRLADEPDVSTQRALILSLGEFDESALSAAGRATLAPKLQEIYRASNDAGLHSAAEWLLRVWGHEAWLRQRNGEWAQDGAQRERRLEDIGQTLAKQKLAAPPQWYVNGQGLTMIVLSGTEGFLMGSPDTEANRLDIETRHLKRIGRSFALAAKPLTMEQSRQFAKGYGLDNSLIMKFAPDGDCPVIGISWYQAAAYCNWLSDREGIDSDQWCYELDEKRNMIRLKSNYLSLAGYRLPTEAEIEYATRAGAGTAHFYGDTDLLLGKYAWYDTNSGDRSWPSGEKKPNDFGFFDVHGNVCCWTQDAFLSYPQGGMANATDDAEGVLFINDQISRMLRGGSFASRASLVRSANRLNNSPTTRNYFNGFRPARTLTP